MAIGDAMVAPAGLQNQMYGQPSRVPGYSQGLGQAPGQMALPPEPMPIGRPTAVVGGPAYFTPQGYNAPPQPTQAFMPTDVRPDPIGQQFMRQMESPMGQQFQQQYEATQAPIREAEMAQRAEEQAAQDARFQEMMDRIAELEGQLATPTPSPVPEPEPFVPGGPFPGIPDFIRDIDFSNLPNFDIDYDDLMDQYRDRIEMGEPEPIDSFLPGPKRDAGAMPPENNFFVDGDGNLNVSDGILRPMGMPPASTMPLPSFSMPELPDFSNIPGLQTGPILKSKGLGKYSLDESDLQRAIAEMGAVRKEVPMQTPTMGMPAQAPQDPIPMTLPNYTPNIPNIDFSNLPKPGRMPKMDFSNLRNTNLR